MTTPAPVTPTGSTPSEPGSQPATPPAPPAPAPTPPEPAAPATPPAPPAPAAEPPVDPKAKAPKFDGDFDPARFEKLVENLRSDVEAEKAKRTAAEKAFEQKAADQQADLIKKFAAAFGLDTSQEKPPTPEELTAKLAEEQNRTKASDDRARQTQVELAVYKAAGQHGGDPDSLLDSRGFAQAIAKLDPASPEFAASVEKAVKAAVEANPKLAAKAAEPVKPPVPAGGAPMDGAPGSKKQLGAEDAKRMTPEQITKATEEGRFNSYLAGGR